MTFCFKSAPTAVVAGDDKVWDDDSVVESFFQFENMCQESRNASRVKEKWFDGKISTEFDQKCGKTRKFVAGSLFWSCPPYFWPQRPQTMKASSKCCNATTKILIGSGVPTAKIASQYQNIVIFLPTVLMEVMSLQIVRRTLAKPSISLVKRPKNASL